MKNNINEDELCLSQSDIDLLFRQLENGALEDNCIHKDSDIFICPHCRKVIHIAGLKESDYKLIVGSHTFYKYEWLRNQIQNK